MAATAEDGKRERGGERDRSFGGGIPFGADGRKATLRFPALAGGKKRAPN